MIREVGFVLFLAFNLLETLEMFINAYANQVVSHSLKIALN